MPAKAVVSTVLVIIFLSLLLFMIEYFVPISANFTMKNECRKTLLRLENNNGLTTTDINELRTILTNKGFTVVEIDAPNNTKRGNELFLKVVADFKYNRLTGIFKREDVTQRMEYHKYTIQRKIIN